VFERLVDDGVDDAGVYNNLAWSYLHTGDERALANAELAYEMAPNDGEIVDTLGWILVSQGALERGEALLRDAYLLKPADAEIGYHLAYALSRTGNAEEAIGLLEAMLSRGAGERSADVRTLLATLRSAS
jgi:Flp pilus assembly protein TadD